MLPLSSTRRMICHLSQWLRVREKKSGFLMSEPLRLLVPVPQVRADGGLRVEVLGELDARAAPRARAGEALAHGARELLDELAHDLRDELARHARAPRGSSGASCGAPPEQRLVRLDAREHLGVRDDLVDLVALDGVLLEALDRLLREEAVHLVEPLGHGELRGRRAALARRGCRDRRVARLRGRRASESAASAARSSPLSARAPPSALARPRRARAASATSALVAAPHGRPRARRARRRAPNARRDRSPRRRACASASTGASTSSSRASVARVRRRWPSSARGPPRRSAPSRAAGSSANARRSDGDRDQEVVLDHQRRARRRSRRGAPPSASDLLAGEREEAGEEVAERRRRATTPSAAIARCLVAGPRRRDACDQRKPSAAPRSAGRRRRGRRAALASPRARARASSASFARPWRSASRSASTRADVALVEPRVGPGMPSKSQRPRSNRRRWPRRARSTPRAPSRASPLPQREQPVRAPRRARRTSGSCATRCAISREPALGQRADAAERRVEERVGEDARRRASRQRSSSFAPPPRSSVAP